MPQDRWQVHFYVRGHLSQFYDSQIPVHNDTCRRIRELAGAYGKDRANAAQALGEGGEVYKVAG